jgi:hypothetical protein
MKLSIETSDALKLGVCWFLPRLIGWGEGRGEGESSAVTGQRESSLPLARQAPSSQPSPPVGAKVIAGRLMGSLVGLGFQ